VTESPQQSSSKETPPPKGKSFNLIAIVGRLVFLGLVGIIGTGAGIALGVFSPDRTPKEPFLEKTLQKIHLMGETRVTSPSISNINNSPEVSSPPLPLPKASMVSPNPPATSPSPPSSPEKLQTQKDLQQAQQQLKELSDRTTSLEQKSGISSSKDNLETRLERLAQQLATKTPSPASSSTLLDNSSSKTTQSTPSPTTSNISPSSSPITTPTTTTSPAIAPTSPPPNPLLPLTYGGTNQKKITLPPDSLFDSSIGNNSTLRPESILLLSQVASELRGITGTTVQVAVHSNLAGEAESDRRLSFQQAKTIREYLATQLGDRFRFVAIGYGSTRPLFVAEGNNRPENRRIEIIVE